MFDNSSYKSGQNGAGRGTIYTIRILLLIFKYQTKITDDIDYLN